MTNQDKIEVRINVEIIQPLQYTGGIRFSDSFTIQARGFLELAKILSQFDDLAKAIQKDESK